MSAPKSTEPTAKAVTGTGAESPTTVRPLDMEDDDVQEPAQLLGDAQHATVHETAEAPAPVKPPRPLSAQQQAENTLKEAFPNIDAAVVKAVLRASGGRVEPAFNALLGMSDPDAVAEHEPPPPAQPPRPIATQTGSTPQSQLEADELYARQLAEHYDSSTYNQPQSNRGSNPQRPVKKNTQWGQNLKPNELHDENYSFIDDDLPVIKENLRKGFLDTQTKVNGWITTLRKRIDGEDEEYDAPQSSNMRPQNPQYGTRRSGDARRSGDYNRYDADPQVLGDDFAGIQLNDDGSERRPGRQNPDLFKPTPNLPKADGRKVAFQNNPSEEDLYRASPKLAASNAPKQSKWQPLSTAEPGPVENDPFSLGDSEDEKETKTQVAGKDEAKKAAQGVSEPAVGTSKP